MRSRLLIRFFLFIAALVLGSFWVEFYVKQASRAFYEGSAEVQATRAKFKAYVAGASKLPPAEAAAQWLVLFDSWTLVNQDVKFEELIQTLPPAQSWGALAEAIEKRPKDQDPLQLQCLTVMSAILRGDAQARQQAMTDLRDLIAKDAKIAKRGLAYFQQAVNRIGLTLDTLAGNAQEQVAALAATVESYEKDEALVEEILIPDLLQDADEATVAPLIRRVLKLKAGISVSGEQTRRLTAKLALEHLSDLKNPVWEFVETEADLPLYEGLVKKFPDDASSSRDKAGTFYLLHLIAAGKTEEAMSFTLNQITSENATGLPLYAINIQDMQKQGFGRQMLEFLRLMLRQQPALPLWQVFIELSAQEGQSQEALQLLRETVAKPDLGTKARSEVESHLYRALLAADEVDEGVKVLREMVKRGPQKPAAQTKRNALEELPEAVKKRLSPAAQSHLETVMNQSQDSPEKDQFVLAEKLFDLAFLLKKPDVTEEALQAVQAAYAQISKEGDLPFSELETVSGLLVKAGRSLQAEAFLKEQLAEALHEGAARHSLPSTPGVLMILMQLYHEQGRYADMVQLLDTSPGWLANDLAAIPQSLFGESKLFLPAKALAETGQKDIAQRIVQREVQRHPDQDALYALLLSLGGDGLEARLDALHAAHRFQERPLIWKAQLQLNQGRLEEAEKTVRAAIAIDPSDGEQGKGDRMRAYAVLADILDRKGDAGQAKVMRSAVKAIRISENADDWWEAGLLSRAVALYEEALTHFADAYCIQSRLALRYSELGDFAKAEMHYRRAFELMPSSFGRVESHCFGCEGAFKGKRAQNIADQVFTRLVQEMPDKPQVAYLLGYLRDQQGNHTEALRHYRRAVELDPDYLNAWKKLVGMTDHLRLPRDEREQAALALFRLAPTSRSKGLESMANLSLLWDAILAAEAARTPRDTSPLYPLPASAEFAAKNADVRRQMEYQQRHADDRTDYRENFGENRMVQTIGLLFHTVKEGRF